MKRDIAEKSPLLKRVRRIEGQVGGIARMIEEDRYCPDILNTISAVHAALRGLEAKLLEDHVHHCVMGATQAGKKEAQTKLNELVDLYKRRFVR